MISARCPLLCLAFAGAGLCQDLAWERIGQLDRTQLGQHVVALPDMNGDGHPDVLTTEIAYLGALQYEKRILILSGRDGSTLRIAQRYDLLKVAPFAIFYAGDANGDGVGDYAAVMASAPVSAMIDVVIYSGADDRVLYRVTGVGPGDGFGSAIAGDVDLTGDGKSDLLVHARIPYEVRAFASGGRPLYTLRPDGQLWPSHSLASIGDLDGDGCDDFVMAVDHVSGRGGAALVSGRTGKYLRIGLGDQYGDLIGGLVAACADMDGDGVRDFAASGGPQSFRGYMRAWSSRTGAVLHTWFSTGWSDLGYSFAGGIDADQDGVGDIVAGGPRDLLASRQTGTVRVLSGRDAGTIMVVHGDPPGATSIGTFVIVLPPGPSHPFPLVVYCEPSFGPGTGTGPLPVLGRIRAMRPLPPAVRVTGAACAGSLERAPRLGLRDLDGRLGRVTLADAPPSAIAILCVGLSDTTFAGTPLPLPIGAFGFPGCSLRASIDVALWARTGAGGIQDGYAAVVLPRPFDALARTPRLHAQWLVLEAVPAVAGGATAAASFTVR